MPSTTPEAPLVDVKGLTVDYGARRGLLPRRGRAVRAVDNVSFSIPRGETLGLVGESGCGKTSVARALLLLERPTAGQISFLGKNLRALKAKELRAMRRHMQLIYQDPHSSLDPRLRVREIIGEPLAIHRIGSRRDRERRIDDLARVVGLQQSDLDHFPHEFSGGQRQRIGIARALALRPALVVCDEPTSALDVSIRAQILNLLTELQAELQLTYLFIAHDLAVIDHVSDNIAVMYLGHIVEIATPSQLRAAPGHPYTVALLSAMPVADPDRAQKARRIVLQGDLPSQMNPPTGCAFHTRCWLYRRLEQPAKCRTLSPQLNARGPRHQVACHFTDEVRLEAMPSR